jgi:hypothetical protein
MLHRVTIAAQSTPLAAPTPACGAARFQRLPLVAPTRYARSMRFWRGGGWLVLGVVASVSCGGRTIGDGPPARDGEDNTAGSTSAGAGPGARTIDGVPIGDCQVPARQPEGCPQSLSSFETPCRSRSGSPLTCVYDDIRVAAGRATQVAYVCDPKRDAIWGTIEKVCGKLCGAPGPNVIELLAPCETAPASSCKDAGAGSPFESAQGWLDRRFSGVVTTCLADQGLDRHLLLEFEHGCPSRVSGRVPFSNAEVQCLSSSLNGAHWECARDLSCSDGLSQL